MCQNSVKSVSLVGCVRWNGFSWQPGLQMTSGWPACPPALSNPWPQLLLPMIRPWAGFERNGASAGAPTSTAATVPPGNSALGRLRPQQRVDRRFQMRGRPARRPLPTLSSLFMVIRKERKGRACTRSKKRLLSDHISHKRPL